VQRRWLLVAAAVTLAATLAGIGWVYTHPPLRSYGYYTMRRHDGDIVVYGVDLDNNGRWPLTLTAVTREGEELLPPHAVAVANFADSELAGSAAARDLQEHGYKLTFGAVYGWEILPAERVRHFRYAIRLWDTGPGTYVVHYRYLGLPLKYEITVG